MSTKKLNFLQIFVYYVVLGTHSVLVQSSTLGGWADAHARSDSTFQCLCSLMIWFFKWDRKWHWHLFQYHLLIQQSHICSCINFLFLEHCVSEPSSSEPASREHLSNKIVNSFFCIPQQAYRWPHLCIENSY